MSCCGFIGAIDFLVTEGDEDAMSNLPVKLPGRFLIDLEMSSYIVQIHICMYTVQTVGSGHYVRWR